MSHGRCRRESKHASADAAGGQTAPPAAELGHHRRLARRAAGGVGDIRPRRQSGVRVLSERDRRGGLAARAHRQALGGAQRQLAAVPARLWARDPDRRADRARHRAFPHRGSGDRHLHHRRLCHAAGGAGAAARVVAGPRLRGQGGGDFPDVGLPDLHQHLGGRDGGAEDMIEVGKSFVAPDSVILRRIVLPATLPYIMAGIRLAVGRAVVAMVIAEFFTSISGLGAIIITSANNFDTATMFVPIVILMVMAIGLTYLIGAVERWVAPWQAEIAARDE